MTSKAAETCYTIFVGFILADGVRLTKRRCEEFFSRRRNFLKSAKEGSG